MILFDSSKKNKPHVPGKHLYHDHRSEDNFKKISSIQDSQRLLELFSWKHPWTPRAKRCGGAKFSWEQQRWKYDEFLAGIPGPNCFIPEHWRYLEHILPLLNLLLRWLVLEFLVLKDMCRNSLQCTNEGMINCWSAAQVIICIVFSLGISTAFAFLTKEFWNFVPQVFQGEFQWVFLEASKALTVTNAVK